MPSCRVTSRARISPICRSNRQAPSSTITLTVLVAIDQNDVVGLVEREDVGASRVRLDARISWAQGHVFQGLLGEPVAHHPLPTRIILDRRQTLRAFGEKDGRSSRSIFEYGVRTSQESVEKIDRTPRQPW